jgi:hypothetical protein
LKVKKLSYYDIFRRIILTFWGSFGEVFCKKWGKNVGILG